MTKTAQTVQTFFRKKNDEAKAYLAKMDAKRGADGGSFAYWAEWHALDYIHWEMVMGFWARLMASFEKVLTDGIKDEDLVKRIVDVRDGIVHDILQATARHSTNPMSNLIEEIKVDVYRRITGANSLDSDSLAYLLSTLKRT